MSGFEVVDPIHVVAGAKRRTLQDLLGGFEDDRKYLSDHGSMNKGVEHPNSATDDQRTVDKVFVESGRVGDCHSLSLVRRDRGGPSRAACGSC